MMRVAAVAWSNDFLPKIDDCEKLLTGIARFFDKAARLNIDILVFPAFTGWLHQQLRYPGCNLSELKEKSTQSEDDEFLEFIKQISQEHELYVCPGSFWERSENHIYHTSCIVRGGRVLLKQRQIYLAAWERELGFHRGEKTELIAIEGLQAGIVLSTDAFYPQVSRTLALMGAEIVLCPAGYINGDNPPLQLSGMWQEVQQNKFFAVESGFNGRLGHLELHAESIIHAPLEITRGEDGFLAKSRGEEGLIYCDLDNEARRRAAANFDLLGHLRPDVYRKMEMFRGNS